MRKFSTLLFVSVFAVTGAFAQNDDTQNEPSNITSISDIVNEQQEVTNRNTMEQHFSKVWSRRSYANFSYATTKLSPSNTIQTGVSYNGGVAPEYESQWSAGIQLGRSYRLHKKPIANTLQIQLDYSGFDLNVAHFEQEANGSKIYDSSQKQADGKYYMPWNLQKYEVDYGMVIGPSVTVCPFNYINVKGLHFLQLHGYYHVGYRAGVVYMPKNESADANTSGTDHEAVNNALKLDWGHGMIRSFGAVLSYKVIGVGYEHRAGKMKYKAIKTDDFGKEAYEYDVATNRIFLQLRW